MHIKSPHGLNNVSDLNDPALLISNVSELAINVWSYLLIERITPVFTIVDSFHTISFIVTPNKTKQNYNEQNLLTVH